MFLVYSLKAGINIIREQLTKETRFLPFELALDAVTNRVGVNSKQFWEDGLGNPGIDSNLGFTTCVLLTSCVRQFQAEDIELVTSATFFLP